MSCPDTGLRDFPVQIGNGILGLEEINKSIQEELFIYVSWSPRSNAPRFQQNSPLLDEGMQGTLSSTSTLRFNNLDYTLKTVQITRPQHASFVVGANATDAKAEVIMTFSNNGPLGYTYIILCIPILQAAASSGSEYIEALLSSKLNRRQLTLDSLIPSGRNCVTYSTCLTRTDSSTNRSVPVTANVFVFPYGLKETANRIGLLRTASMGARATDFGLLRLPDNLNARTQTALFVIQAAIDYRTYLRYRVFPTPTVSIAAADAAAANRRTDPTSAYQCVPLKPDDDIKDGKIVIDTQKGVPLSQVLAEKQEDTDADTEGITPGDVERIVAVTFGILLGLFILSIIAYVISLLTSSNAGPAFPRIRELFTGMLPSVFIACVVGIIGFLIGFFAQRM